MTALIFPIRRKNDWPPAPIGSECIPCTVEGDNYRVLVAPLFIKNLSVGDLIRIEAGKIENVKKWKHVEKSRNSVIWIMSRMPTNAALFKSVLDKLKSLNCFISSLEHLGHYSICVPGECKIAKVDWQLDKLGESVFICWPSFRHRGN